MQIKVVRFCDSLTMGVFGEVYFNDELICFSVERHWMNNQPFKSCVPDGTYFMIPYSSAKYPSTWAMHNPENRVFATNEEREYPADRYACLMHKVNWPLQLMGCIAFVSDLSAAPMPGETEVKWMGTNSRDAIKKINEIIGDQDVWQLVIEWKKHGE